MQPAPHVQFPTLCIFLCPTVAFQAKLTFLLSLELADQWFHHAAAKRRELFQIKVLAIEDVVAWFVCVGGSMILNCLASLINEAFLCYR